jgi:hypothetical protein
MLKQHERVIYIIKKINYRVNEINFWYSHHQPLKNSKDYSKFLIDNSNKSEHYWTKRRDILSFFIVN